MQRIGVDLSYPGQMFQYFTKFTDIPPQEMVGVSLLRSTTLLTRTGFLLDKSLVPSSESQNVVEDENIGWTATLISWVLVLVVYLIEPLFSRCAVVQVNRVNLPSLMSPGFQVIFPGLEFNNFAWTMLIPGMVIPGSYIKALIAGVHVGTQIVQYLY